MYKREKPKEYTHQFNIIITIKEKKRKDYNKSLEKAQNTIEDLLNTNKDIEVDCIEDYCS